MASCLTIMATTSSSQSSCQPHPHHHHHHQQVVGKCNRSGTREFTLENTLGCKTLRFFQVKWPSVVAAGRSLFPRLRASIAESGKQNLHDTVARARFHIKRVKKLVGPDETVARARFHAKIVKTDGPLFEDGVEKMCTRLKRELDFTEKA